MGTLGRDSEAALNHPRELARQGVRQSFGGGHADATTGERGNAGFFDHRTWKTVFHLILYVPKVMTSVECMSPSL